MKQIAALAALVLCAVSPLHAAGNENCREAGELTALHAIRTLIVGGASSYDVDQAIDARIAALREGWMRWVRPASDAPVDKRVHVVAAAEGSTPDHFEAACEHPFAVKVVVPAKRSLFNRNNPVWVGTLRIRFDADGKTRTKELPVNGWMNPDTSRTVDLGAIAERAEASLEAASRNPREAVVEIHFVQARAEDDPANPSFDTIQLLQRIGRDSSAATLDAEIARRERALMPDAEPFPVTTFISDLRRAGVLMRSKKESDQEKGKKLLEETLRQLR